MGTMIKNLFNRYFLSHFQEIDREFYKDLFFVVFSSAVVLFLLRFVVMESDCQHMAVNAFLKYVAPVASRCKLKT